MERLDAMIRRLGTDGTGGGAPRPARLAATTACLAALLVLSVAQEAAGQAQVFTDEAAYRAALASTGATALDEGFEGAAWDGVRSTIAGGSLTAPSVTSQGVTWSASAGVTTNDLSPRSGAWRAYDHPGGAPDTLKGTSGLPLHGIGGWFTSNTPPTSLRLLIDGTSPDNARLQLSSSYQFLGVVSSQGFTRFEIVGDGTSGDEKHWFADDFVIGTTQLPQITGVVCGVAAVSGLRGSDWHSDLWIHNHGAVSATVELYFAPAGGTPRFDAPYVLDVAPGHTRAIRDVVAAAFGLDAVSGALLYRVTGGDPASLVMRADTYNRLNTHERYGQNITGISIGDAPAAGTLLVLPGLADPVQYRYNLGLQSAAGRRAVVRIIDASSGTILHTATVALQALGWVQVVNLQQTYALGTSSGWYVEVEGLDGPVLATASLIDQQSNDGVNLVGRPRGPDSGVLWLPGAAHLGGLLGSTWRSDLLSVNPHGQANQAAIGFFPRGEAHPDGVPPAAASLELGAYSQTASLDVLGGLLARPDGSVGVLGVTQDAQLPILHLLRTYNDTVGPSGERLTYGSATPAVPEEALIGDQVEGVVVGIQHDADTRANLALANAHRAADGSPRATPVDIDLVGPDGALLAHDSLLLEPYQNIQVDRFPEVLLGAGAVVSDATLVVRAGGFIPGDTGGVLPLVSLVNGNRTAGMGTSDPQAIIGLRFVSAGQ